MMLLPLPRGVKLVPPMTRVASIVEPGERLPLDAELGRLVGRDFDDQRFDEDLRAAHVELVDDRAHVVVDGSGAMMISELFAVSAWIVPARPPVPPAPLGRHRQSDLCRALPPDVPTGKPGCWARRSPAPGWSRATAH